MGGGGEQKGERRCRRRGAKRGRDGGAQKGAGGGGGVEGGGGVMTILQLGRLNCMKMFPTSFPQLLRISDKCFPVLGNFDERPVPGSERSSLNTKIH